MKARERIAKIDKNNTVKPMRETHLPINPVISNVNY